MQSSMSNDGEHHGHRELVALLPIQSLFVSKRGRYDAQVLRVFWLSQPLYCLFERYEYSQGDYLVVVDLGQLLDAQNARIVVSRLMACELMVLHQRHLQPFPGGFYWLSLSSEWDHLDPLGQVLTHIGLHCHGLSLPSPLSSDSYQASMLSCRKTLQIEKHRIDSVQTVWKTNSLNQDARHNKMISMKGKRLECSYMQQEVDPRCLTSYRDLVNRRNRPASSC